MGLSEATRAVAGMVHSGAPFDAIEDGIQAIPGLLDDERSGLWLYAWSRQSGAWQRDASSRLLLWLTNGVDSEPTSTRDEKPPITP
jgi:hypothetical protein